MTLRSSLVVRTLIVAVVLAVGSVVVPGAPAATEKLPPVTLLVHGMTWNPKHPKPGWGEVENDSADGPRWSGMIGALEARGRTFGGVIRPQGASLRLPNCLDRSAVRGDTTKAGLFALEFSEGANVDGLAYKALELAECLKELRKYTGCQRFNLVCFSAGGLVARTYVQSALPGVVYNRDVERLITIATPHFGSEKAEHWGDFLGTRATCMKPGCELIRRLNNELDLPGDVCFASVVVRGVAIGRSGPKKTCRMFDDCIDGDYLNRLPIDFQMGTDQIVEVRSQNLRLAPSARRYEQTTRRPIHYLCARVPDPTPKDLLPWELTVHEICPNHESVTSQVATLVTGSDGFWNGLSAAELNPFVAKQARGCAYGLIEREAMTKHSSSEVNDICVEQLDFVKYSDNGVWRYRFSGWAYARGRYLRVCTSLTQVTGTIDLYVDRYGRVVGWQEYQVAIQK